jgi:elongation factor G
VSKRQVWLLEFTIEPRFGADAERLVLALATMASEHMTFGYFNNSETGELIVKGIDEQCLNVVTDALKQRFKIEVNLGAPQVAYRETIARISEVDYTHKSQTGSTSQFARVKLKIEPNLAGAGNEFESRIVGGAVPKEYIPGVEKGIQSVWDAGVLFGFPMVDTKVTLNDGAYHEVDSSSIAFEIAARTAMKEGAERAGVKLLEPIMDVEVVTPSEFVSSVIGDINSRRGHIRSQQMRATETVIHADVPFADLFGWRSRLNSITNGLASYATRFSRYAEAPVGEGPDDFQPAVGMRA